MSNLDFFKTCMQNEMEATFAILSAIPSDKLNYTPHPINRTAYEIAEHITAHVYDFNVILKNDKCDEKLSCPFSDSADIAKKMKSMWLEAMETLESYTEQKWHEENVELLVGGEPFATMPRFQMMWFFLNDIIHHRGQLSSYIRPMGGKNPAVYGYSADTI